MFSSRAWGAAEKHQHNGLQSQDLVRLNTFSLLNLLKPDHSLLKPDQFPSPIYVMSATELLKYATEIAVRGVKMNLAPPKELFIQ